MTRKRFDIYIAVIFFLMLFLWCGGLILFVDGIGSLSEPIMEGMPTTDAIVVLTGGSERLTTGLTLLEAGKAKKLFVSGVHPGLTLDKVLAKKSIPQNLHDCCIILGHEAESTRGNAEETHTWMAAEDYHSLRLVTANYHMPRSLLVFHAEMPDIAITPHPIAPDSVILDDWWMHPGTASLLITEYNKYLLAIFRLRMEH